MPSHKNPNIRQIVIEEAPEALTLTMANISFEVLLDYRAEPSVGIPEHCCAPHSHVAYELSIITEGEIVVAVNGKALRLSAGDFLIINPDVSHKIKTASDDISRFSFRFAPIPLEVGEEGKRPYIKGEIEPELREFLRNVIDSLRQFPEGCNSFTEELKKAELSVILSAILERAPAIPFSVPTRTSVKSALYAKIENYLYRHYNRPITLEYLSESLSYSRTQMRRIFDEGFHMSFTEKLREIRLSAACDYLRESELSIDEIAERCGYETRQGFEAMFLKYIGVTPNKYRRG